METIIGLQKLFTVFGLRGSRVQGSSTASRLTMSFWQCRHLPQGSTLPSPIGKSCVSWTLSSLRGKNIRQAQGKHCCQLTRGELWISPHNFKQARWNYSYFPSPLPLEIHSQQCCEVSFQQLPEFLFWPMCWSRKHSNSFWFVLHFFKWVCDLEQNSSLDTSPVSSDRAVVDPGSDMNNWCCPVLWWIRTWDVISALCSSFFG